MFGLLERRISFRNCGNQCRGKAQGPISCYCILNNKFMLPIK